MELLIAVAKDLYLFVVEAVQAITPQKRKDQPTLFELKQAEVLYAASPVQRVAIPAPLLGMKEEPPRPMVSIGDLLKQEREIPLESPSHHEREEVALQKNTIVYTHGTDVAFRKTPEIGSDNVIERIPYGSMLVALESFDGWVRAFHKGVEGWIALEDIADRAAYVYPQFALGEKNAYDDPNTARLRAIIRDEFCYGETDMPLQAEEYVLYKLYRRGAHIAWGHERPRIPGRWADILSDVQNVTVHETPFPRTVMEWQLEDGAGHVAYVEALFPDESIQISEANWPNNGIYNERVLVKDEWLRLKPKFLGIS